MAPRRLRLCLIVLIPLAGCDAAAGTIGGFKERERSPFALYDHDGLRAGTSYERIDQDSREEPPSYKLAKKRRRPGDPPLPPRPTLQCEASWGGAERCSHVITPGKMVIIFDSTKHAIRITIITDEKMFPPNPYGQERGVYKNYVEAMRTSWDTIGEARQATGPHGVGAEFRWLDPEGKSSAEMWYSSYGRYLSGPVHRTLFDTLFEVPDSIAVSDVAAYVAYMKRQPAAPKVVEEEPEPDTIGAGARARREEVMALMRELEQVIGAQRSYLQTHRRFAGRLADLQVQPRGGVTLDYRFVGPDGWTLTGTSASLPGLNCVAYGGEVIKPPRTKRDNLGAPRDYVACDDLF